MSKKKKDSKGALSQFWSDYRYWIIPALFSIITIVGSRFSPRDSISGYILIWSILLMSALLALLFIKERNVQKRLMEKDLMLSNSLQEKSVISSKNEGLEIENSLLKKIDHKYIELKKLFETEEYSVGRHTFKALSNHRRLNLILNQLKGTEVDFNSELAKIIHEKDPDSFDSKYESLIDQTYDEIELALKLIGEYIVESSNSQYFEITISLFFMVKSEENMPEAKKILSINSNTGIDEKEELTIGQSYSLLGNTDFMAVHDKINDFKLSGDENFFFCRNNIPFSMEEYRDENHKLYYPQDHNMRFYRYVKGQFDYILPYKSIITSPIYDVADESIKVDNISGFLSVSTRSVDSFTRSDTLILQVLSSQINNICSLIN